MKTIGGIHINDAPVGMLIQHPKHKGQYYKATVVKGQKNWVPTKMRGGGDPSPEEHSWAHHHAPLYQVFNNYVCLKRDALGEFRDFFFELFSKNNYAMRQDPFVAAAVDK